MQPRIVISIGDYNGIGPEVIIKAVYEMSQKGEFTPVILGSSKIIDYYLDTMDIDFSYNSIISSEEIEDDKVNVLECLQNDDIVLEPGKIQRNAGKAAMQAVETGINLCVSNKANALVTAPISKVAIQLAGYPYPGHTEFLANKTHSRQFMMLMVNDALRIGLVTIHIPVSKICSEITQSAIVDRLESMHDSLLHDFGITDPKIGVLGLNPHAGDGGVIGQEEIDLIRPSLEEVHNSGIHAEGPFPADGFFGNRKYEEFDGILAMYHDQGLVPFKTLSFNHGVNFTAGLPIIRTSPDHGTAFDIAGKNKANEKSMIQAIDLALKLSINRKKFAK